MSGVLVVRSTQGECSSRCVGWAPPRSRSGERDRQGQAAPGGVARQHDPGLRRPAGDQVRERRAGVAPGVLGRQRVVRQHHPGVQRLGQPGGVPHVGAVHRGDEATAVQVDHRARRGGAARRHDVRREVAAGPGQGLDLDREPPGEAAHRPGGQAPVEAGVPPLEAGALDVLVLELAGAAQPRHRPGDELVAQARGARGRRGGRHAPNVPQGRPVRVPGWSYAGGTTGEHVAGRPVVLRVRTRRRPYEPAPVSTGEGSST